MAIIYSYPIATPQDTDLLIISRTPEDPDEISNYSVDMSSVADYVIDEAFNGTDRYIPRFDGTSSLVNSVIYEDSNGTIGIGTANPSQKLHVVGNARVTGAYRDSLNSPGTSGQILSSTVTGTYWIDGTAIPGVPDGSGTAGKIVMWQDSDTLTDSKITQTAGSETNYVDVDFANVEDLTITGDSSFSSFTVNNFDAVNFTNINNNFNVGSGDLAIAINDNSMSLGTPTADSDTLTVGYTTTRFIGTGNVGIGTTSPASKLHILKTIDASGSLENNLQLKVENTVEDRPSGIEFRSNRNGSASDSGAIAYTTTSATVSTRQIHLIPEIGASGDLSNSSLIAKGGGQVRIGNSSYPTKALEIYGTSLLLEPGSGQSFTFEHTRNANIYFEVNNQTVLTLGKNNGGSVGIGTISPTHKLQVFGNGAFNSTLDVQDPDVSSNGVLRLSHDSTGSNLYSNPASSNVSTVVLRLGINNSEKMRIANNGNVGIATTSPSAKLHIEGDGSIMRLQNNNSDANGTFIDFRDSTGTRTGYLGTTGASDDMFIFTQASKPIRFFTNATERARVSANGNVGIGTTDPGEKLSVAPNTDASAEIGEAHVGNIGFSGYAGFSHVDTNSQGNYALLQNSSGLTYLNASSGQSISFRIANSDKMILNSSGNVGIGTTSPGVKLDVNGRFRVQDNGNIALDVNTDGTFQIGDTAEVGGGAFITGDNTDIDIVMQGGPVVTFKNSGNVGIGTNIPASKLEVDGGDIEIDDSASGLILRSPNGTRYRVQVDNSGNLTTTAI